MDIEKILTEGIVFKGSKPSTAKKEDKGKDKGKEENVYHRIAWLRLCKDES